MQAIKEGLTRTSVALPIIQVAMEALGHLETSSQDPRARSLDPTRDGVDGVLLFMLRGDSKEIQVPHLQGRSRFLRGKGSF